MFGYGEHINNMKDIEKNRLEAKLALLETRGFSWLIEDLQKLHGYGLLKFDLQELKSRYLRQLQESQTPGYTQTSIPGI